jgi:hypothetical protein
MPGEVIEDDLNCLREFSILPPMPIVEPILDPDDTPYALFPEPHNDHRNPQQNHRSHKDHMDNEEELRQWLQCVRNWLECMPLQKNIGGTRKKPYGPNLE